MSLRIFLLNRLAPIRRKIRIFFLHVKGYTNISFNSVVEHDVKLDRVNPKGIYLGDYSSFAKWYSSSIS